MVTSYNIKIYGASQDYFSKIVNTNIVIKTRFEETMLRIATVAIMFVATGIFVIFS